MLKSINGMERKQERKCNMGVRTEVLKTMLSDSIENDLQFNT